MVIVAKPEVAVAVEVALRVQRAADADVRRRLQRQQALLGRPAERRAMGVRRTEVGVPGVEVGVEVDQRDRPVLSVQCPQQRQRDGVVAAEGDDAVGPAEQAGRRRLDGRDGLEQVERVDPDVAGVGDLVDVPRVHVELRVERPEQLGPGPQCLGPEPGTRPVGRTAVERHAQDRHRSPAHVVQARQPGEGVRPGEARDLQPRRWPHRRLAHLGHQVR